jgi:hypothetical protein
VFPQWEEILKDLLSQEFRALPARKRFHGVNERLALLIKNSEKTFLLSAVTDFIDRINQLKILREPYHISLFEFWLNQFSHFSDEENYQIRAKIAGKHIPRDDYQAFFPIGMGKTYQGTHFVAAHLSPDVDTMVASFWGWVDAFAARVGNARHIWSLPGGPPDSPVTELFRTLFGKKVFSTLCSTSHALTLSALDLVSDTNVSKKRGSVSIAASDLLPEEKAIILVNEEGHYLGDWHYSDIEPIRKIIIRFKSCLRWFENNLHVQLISFFAKKELYASDIPELLSRVFDVAICDCEPAREFTDRQKKDLGDFFSQVIGLEEGLNSTFRQLNAALTRMSVHELSHFQQQLEGLYDSGLFEDSGRLKEDRPAIFLRFEAIIKQLDLAIHRVRDYVEQLDIAMHVKNKVFGIPAKYLTLRSDMEEIRIKML